MSLFEKLVNEALSNQGDLAPLQMVVEKELLHHDILREMSSTGLLANLTFIGGTCLRTCYGSNRLSEDLDFTGGQNFTRESLAELGGTLINRLQVKYGLQVAVSEPVRETGNTDTWKLKVTTHPQQPHMPVQRIHIDICSVPSYERQPMLLRNYYNVDMGTAGLIIQAQSRSEILADKIIALALRPNRVKNRDLWDIGWLKQKNVNLPQELIPKKVADHKCKPQDFQGLLGERVQLLDSNAAMRDEFIKEIRRFLPPGIVSDTVEKEEYWDYLKRLVQEECDLALQAV